MNKSPESQQSGILERKDNVFSSLYAYLVHLRVKMRVSYFIFYKHDIIQLLLLVIIFDVIENGRVSRAAQQQ